MRSKYVVLNNAYRTYIKSIFKHGDEGIPLANNTSREKLETLQN